MVYKRPPPKSRAPPRKLNVASALSTASKALTVAYGVKKLLNVEKKYVDFAATGTLSGTPLVVALNAIAQGDGGSTRDGDQCKITSINGHILVRNGSATTPGVARLMIVHDKQSDGTAPTLSEILEGTSQYQILTSPINMDNSRRFKILWDKRVDLDPFNAGNSGIFKQYSFYEKMELHTRYSGTSNNVSDISSNGLFFVVQMYNADNDTNYVDYWIRSRFVDN